MIEEEMNDDWWRGSLSACTAHDDILLTLSLWMGGLASSRRTYVLLDLELIRILTLLSARRATSRCRTTSDAEPAAATVRRPDRTVYELRAAEWIRAAEQRVSLSSLQHR